VLERLAEQGGGTWILAKVDIDANPRIAQAFVCSRSRRVIALAGGQPVEAFSGAQPEPQVRQWIEALIAQFRDQLPGIKAAEAGGNGVAEEEVEPPEDPRFVEAEDALDRGDYTAAEAAYQRIPRCRAGQRTGHRGDRPVRFLARAENADPTRSHARTPTRTIWTPSFAAADAELATDRTEAAFTRLVAAVGAAPVPTATACASTWSGCSSCSPRTTPG